MIRPAITVPYLQVILMGGNIMTYTNPKPWTCLKFSTCSYWHRTDIVYWYRLGSKQYGIFYESDKCVSGGLYHYITDLSTPEDGARMLNQNQPIRSMMVGETSDKSSQPTITYVDNCPSEEKLQLLNGSNVLITYNTSDGLDGSEGLSSNWNVSADIPSSDDTCFLWMIPTDKTRWLEFSKSIMRQFFLVNASSSIVGSEVKNVPQAQHQRCCSIDCRRTSFRRCISCLYLVSMRGRPHQPHSAMPTPRNTKL